MTRTAAAPQLDRSLARDVARSLGAEILLLPFLPTLLEDLSELGGSVLHVLQALKALGLPPASRALDLGCGKGVLAVRLAEQFDFEVTGVDAFPPFVQEARLRACENGVSDRCRFRCEDLRAAVDEPSEYDLALMVGLGPVLGPVENAVGTARRRVRPGGYILIDGSFRTDGARHGRDQLPTHDDMIVRLTARGDAVAQEIVPAPHEIAQLRLLSVRSIRRKAEVLGLKHSRFAAAFRRYVEAHEQEALNGDGQSYALWVLSRR